VSFDKSSTAPSDTVYSRYVRPVLRYIIQLGEAMALAVFFHIAADQTESTVIDVMSFLITCTVAAYMALPVGLLGQRLDHIKTKDWRVAFAIALPLGALMAFGAHHIGSEISQAVSEIARFGSTR
jgi:hypothetical protein